MVDETTKEQLDPNGLGIRYAEIEGICREMRDRANEYYTRNVAVLNADQKTKLKVLEDALKLAPVISEAQYGNLIGGLASAPYGFTGRSSGLINSIIGVSLSFVSGCYLPFGFASGDIDVAQSGRNLRAPTDPAGVSDRPAP